MRRLGMSGAKTDVRVRVRAGVVAVRREDASVHTIVPIATAVEHTPQLNHPLCWLLRLIDGLQPAA